MDMYPDLTSGEVRREIVEKIAQEKKFVNDSRGRVRLRAQSVILDIWKRELERKLRLVNIQPVTGIISGMGTLLTGLRRVKHGEDRRVYVKLAASEFSRVNRGSAAVVSSYAETLRDLLRTEGQMMKNLQQKALPQEPHSVIIEQGEVEINGVSFPYLIMEEMEGETLDKAMDIIFKNISSPAKILEVQLDLMIRIAFALALHHRSGIMHLDIKPANLMIYIAETICRGAKILDFGLSKPGPIYENLDGHAIGTPGWMSPEASQGKKLTYSSDVFSLGILFLVILKMGEEPRTFLSLKYGFAIPNNDMRMVRIISLVEQLPLEVQKECDSLVNLLTDMLAVDQNMRPMNGGKIFRKLCDIYREVTGTFHPLSVHIFDLTGEDEMPEWLPEELTPFYNPIPIATTGGSVGNEPLRFGKAAANPFESLLGRLFPPDSHKEQDSRQSI